MKNEAHNQKRVACELSDFMHENLLKSSPNVKHIGFCYLARAELLKSEVLNV